MSAYRDLVIQNMRKLRDIGSETIQLVTVTESICTTCGWDPVAKAAKDPYCRTCGGKGKIVTETKHNILAHKREYTGVEQVYNVQGIMPAGTIVVDFMREDLDALGITMADVKRVDINNSAYRIVSTREDRWEDEVFGYTLRCEPVTR